MSNSESMIGTLSASSAKAEGLYRLWYNDGATELGEHTDRLTYTV